MTENRLAAEASPYLRQHKDNPVHWWPWGPEALAEAEATGKPILLSIGYAACHWCHVMAHESFEDEATAAVMNENYINIKVDREERPDIDRLYMTALQLMNIPGGWPMTMFLDPKGVPFYGGTYFPKEPRDGMPSFVSELERVASAVKEQPEALDENTGRMLQTLNKVASFNAQGALSLEDLNTCAETLVEQFDKAHGGLRGAPKFPQPMLLDFLWRNTLRTFNPKHQTIVTHTLDRMCKGGIYDQIGGGFSRYSVDHMWLVPHFEKMLYDNALLLENLTRVWQNLQDPLHAECAIETANWVLREMTLPGGGFASSLDADSEGIEGKFYVWSEAEIDAAISDADAAKLFKMTYGVTAEGNWEGANILNRIGAQAAVSDANKNLLESAKTDLLEARSKRVRPGLDDKVLADWNGLMIAALAEASVAFGHNDWLEAAKAAFRFVAETMSNGDRLYHAAHGNTPKQIGTSDDYANMIHAALTLFETTGDADYLARAQAWAAVLDTHFHDAELGGYFFTADDAEALLIRMRSVADEATPNANGSMVGHLTKLWLLTGDNTYRRQAQTLIESFAGAAKHQPLGVGSFMAGAEFYNTPVQIVIIGRREQAGAEALLHEIFKTALPNRVLQVIDPHDALPKGHPAHGKKQQEHMPTAYICVGTTCSLPVVNPQSFRHALAAASSLITD